jgi:hypothetical protein
MRMSGSVFLVCSTERAPELDPEREEVVPDATQVLRQPPGPETAQAEA